MSPLQILIFFNLAWRPATLPTLYHYLCLKTMPDLAGIEAKLSFTSLIPTVITIQVSGNLKNARSS
jgi:hypothetical protein